MTWEEVYGVVVEGGGGRSHGEGDERHEDLQEGEGRPELLRTEQENDLFHFECSYGGNMTKAQWL